MGERGGQGGRREIRKEGSKEVGREGRCLFTVEMNEQDVSD